jgi:hypothetical protein
LALSVVLAPEQIDAGEALGLSVGVGVTVTVLTSVFVQTPLLPVTVYVIVELGLTVMMLPVSPDGVHVYELAPLAVNVVLLPEQMVVLPAIATVGLVVTVTVTVLTTGQLPPFVTVKV